MSRTDVLVTVTGRRMKETDKAVLFKVTHISGYEFENPKTEWFPFSQIVRFVTDPNSPEKAHEMVVKEWILKQKNLLEAPTKTSTQHIASDGVIEYEEDDYDPDVGDSFGTFP